MVDCITGLTFLYLARHLALHPGQHCYPQRFRLFCRTHYSKLCFLSCSPLITFSLPQQLWSVTMYHYNCAAAAAPAAAAACLINRHIGAEGSSVVVIRDGYGWNGLLSKSSRFFAHFVSEWILSVQRLCWIFSCEASRSPEMLLNKPWTLAVVQIALFNGTDQWTDEMQLDCISETLMVALFDGSCFYYALELCQISALTHRSYSPLGSSYISMFKGARGGSAFYVL